MPKFYLRRFSFDGGERLHLIHARELKPISRIGLKGQCYDDYFYGKDPVVENALQDLEGVTAEVFRGIIANLRLPDRGTPSDFVLRTFICLQWGRTRSRAEASEAMFDKMFKAVHGPELRAKGVSQEQIDEVRIGTDYPGLFSLSVASEAVPFMGDLESKLVLTGGFGEFVTSDAPVVLYNPYLFGRFPGSVIGLNVRGLVIFYPISPDLMVVLYDRECYRVGSPHTRVVALSCRSDIIALNNFQFLHADDAVYFREEAQAANHTHEFSRVARMRRDDRSVVEEAQSATVGDKSSLLVSYWAGFPYRPLFSFLTLLRKRRGETGPVSRVEERNHEISALFEQYRTEVKSGKSKQGFLAYYASRTLHAAGIPLPDFLRNPL